MAVSLATLISLCANVTLAVFGLALAALMLWHDVRRVSNQFFAVCMLLFALHGMVQSAWLVAQPFELDPRPLMYASTSLYVVGVMMLFYFVMSIAHLPGRLLRIQAGLLLPLAAGALALMWSDRLFTDFEPLSGGSYRYDVTPLGLVGVGLVVLVFVSTIGWLHRERNPQSFQLSMPLVIMTVSVMAYAVSWRLRAFPVNTLGLTLAVILLGRLMLRYRVYEPLITLNAELRLKNEQLAEATRLKSQFLANMSHELRTPLNSIIGYTELVISRTYGDLTATQEDRLQKVTRNGQHLLELINDVLDLSRIEAGRLALVPTRVSANGLLDDLLQSFERLAATKNLALLRSYGHLPDIYVDRERTWQILWNLISNAIKFTDEGAVIVRGYYDPRRHQVVISVTDTGQGIPPEEQTRLFEAFSRSEDILTREHEGTGLGLALASRLAEMHGGHTWYESELGRGSTFHVALPAAEESPAVVSIVEPRTRRGGPDVLVIDDDREAIEVLQGNLEAAGFRVHGAIAANDGLKLVRELDPVLILLDWRMPDLDGAQILQVLNRDPQTAAIPVLVVSAADNDGSARHAGAEGFVPKPLRPADLLAEVERILGDAMPSPRRKTRPPKPLHREVTP